MSLHKDIETYFRGRGFNIVVGTHFDQVEKWLSWYRGNVNDFHYYKVNGLNNKLITKEKKTLNMAKQVSEDFARLEFNEKSEVKIENDDKANDFLQKVLEDNEFNVNFIDTLELSKALGDSYIIEYKDGDDIKLDFINAKKAMITSFDNYKINGLVTITQEVETDEDGKITVFCHLQHHQLEFNEQGDKVYTIEHEVFKSASIAKLGSRIDASTRLSLGIMKCTSPVTVMSNGEPIIVAKVINTIDIPLFQRFRPNLKNNFDIDSPYGMSRYANSIDTLKAIDNKYDGYDTEFNNGKNRLFVDSKLTEEYVETPETGADQLTFRKFQGDTEVMVSMPNLTGENEDQPPLFAFTPELREEKYSQAISNELSLLGKKAGLGKNHYDFKMGIVNTTATAVKTSDNEKWMAIEADRIITGKALEGMARAIIQLGVDSGELIIANIDDLEFSIFFDDSVAIDKQAELNNAVMLNEKGLVSKMHILTDVLGMTEEEAADMLKAVQEEQAIENASLFGEEEEDTDEVDEEDTDEEEVEEDGNREV